MESIFPALEITIGYFTINLEESSKWPPANTINPPSKGNYLVPLTSTLLGLSLAAIVSRLYSRAFLVKRFGIDDILILPGFLAVVALTVSMIMSLEYGWGKHIWDNELKNARMTALLGYIVQIACAVAGVFTKLSLLFSYFRFAPKQLRKWIWIVIVFVACWGVGLLMPIVLSCIPINIFWDSLVRGPTDQCIPASGIRIVQYMQGSLNIFSDLVILVLPLPTIWKLALPSRQKWSVVVILALWTLTTIFATLRLWATVRSFTHIDITWYGYELYVFIALEANFAIICACAPGVKPVIVRLWPNFDGVKSSIKRKYSAGTIPTAPNSAPQLQRQSFDFNFGLETRHSSRRNSESNWGSNNNGPPDDTTSNSQLCRPYEPCEVGPLSPLRASRIFSDFISFPVPTNCMELRESDFTIRNNPPADGDISSRRTSVELPPPVHLGPRNQARSPDSYGSINSKISFTVTRTDTNAESELAGPPWTKLYPYAY